MFGQHCISCIAAGQSSVGRSSRAPARVSRISCISVCESTWTPLHVELHISDERGTAGATQLTWFACRLAWISASVRSPFAKSFSLLYSSSSLVSVEYSAF